MLAMVSVAVQFSGWDVLTAWDGQVPNLGIGEILPLNDVFVAVGNRLELTCVLTPCGPQQSDANLYFTFPSSVNNSEGRIPPQNRSDNCNRTLVIPQVTRSHAGRYSCHSANRTGYKKVIIGDVSISDVKCNMRKEGIPSMSCAWCSPEYGYDNTWTVSWSHDDFIESPSSGTDCRRNFRFSGCGLYHFNVTRDNSFGFNVSHQSLNISLSDVQDLTVTNLTVLNQTTSSVSVRWDPPVLPSLEGCPPVNPYYWLSYSTTNSGLKSVPMYLGNDVQFDITGLQPDTTVNITVTMSLVNVPRSGDIPSQVTSTTHPEQPISTQVSQTVVQSKGSLALGITLLCVIPTAIIGFLFLTSYMRKWCRRQRINFDSPPWEHD